MLKELGTSVVRVSLTCLTAGVWGTLEGSVSHTTDRPALCTCSGCQRLCCYLQTPCFSHPFNTLAPPPPQAGDASAAISADLLSGLLLSESASSVAVLVNGVLRADLSRLSGLPKGVYVGGLKGAPAAVVAKMVRRGCGFGVCVARCACGEKG